MNTKRMAIMWTVLLLAAPAFGQNARFPLTLPIGGTPYQDWTIVNYVDRMPGSGLVDYRGGTYTNDGHNAIDFTLPNFAAMDAGVPVFAAADGTITLVHDGEFDRCSRVEACGDAPNWVRIQHAGTIATEYVHLKRGSISVTEGQHVVAGQQIGLVGSSGLSSDAHLHFAVFENESAVETYTDPLRWWDNPLPYAGDVVGSLDHGITHLDPTLTQLVERPADNDVFQQTDGAGQQAFIWAQLHGIDAGDALDFYFYRPDGTQYTHLNWTVSQQLRYDWWRAGINLPSVPDLGTWRVDMQVNGTTLLSDTFNVVPSSATRTWNAGTGNWSTAGNWTPVGTPGASDIVRIVSTDGQGRTVTYDVTAPTLKSLTVDLTGAGANRMTFEMSAGNLALVDGLVVGDVGRATFNQSGGRVTAANPNLDSIVGFHAGGDGIYNLSGNAALSIARDLYVGAFGGSTGTFNQSGGAVTARTLVLGSVAGSMGTYSISGGTLSARTQIEVGRSGVGTLNITNSAQVVSTDGGIIGSAAGSNGSVVIDGAGSKWIDSSSTFIGSSGTGIVTVAGGGELQTPSLLVNRFASGDGTLIVTGTGSKVTVNGEMRVADEGVGLLRVENGGTLITGTRSFLGRNAATADATAVVTGAGSTWTLGQSLTVGGAGRGTLTVADGGVVTAPNGVNIGTQGEALGDGTIVADVTNSGIVAPGTSPGTLHIDGSYSQSSAGKLVIEMASASSFDKLDVTGNLSLGVMGSSGGTLEVLLTDDYVPQGSPSFDILDWGSSLSGTFESIELPTLGGTLTWDTSQLYTTGVLSVVGPTAVPGDSDGDGDVDGADFVVWQTNFPTQTGATLATGDADGDGDVDGADFVIWQTNFPFTPSPSAATVPEPAAWASTIIGAVGLWRLRRRSLHHTPPRYWC